MLALAEDHWNDVLSNLAGIIGPTIAFYVPKVGMGRDPQPHETELPHTRGHGSSRSPSIFVSMMVGAGTVPVGTTTFVVWPLTYWFHPHALT